MLLDLYIKERKLNRTEYLEEHSDHYRSIVFEATTVRNWFNGNNPFPLKHLKGFVDELEVDRGELEYVAGRNPFKPTEEELEEWSEDEGGVGRLLSFYIGLNHAMPVTHYIKNVSRPVTQDGLSWNTVQSWFTGTNPFRLKHLKWLVGDLNVPKMELEKVYGRDPFTLTDQDLDAFSREKGKVGKLFDFYINLNYGLFRIPYLKKSSDYLKSQGLNWGTVNTWCNGNVSFLPKHLKGFAEELGIPPDYVKRVTGVDIGGVVTAKEELDAAFVGYLAND